MSNNLKVEIVNRGPNATRSVVRMGTQPAVQRMMRRPRHTFRLRQLPWVIQPIMIAPVLPGETMQSLLLQARSVTDPVKDKLGGWWHEFYFFYVKHRDLAARDTLVAMHVDGTLLTSLNSAAAVPTYHMGGTPNFVKLCLIEVTEWYFRDAEEAWNATGSTLTVDGEVMPLAKASDRLWWDSLKLAGTPPSSFVGGTGSDLPGSFNTTLPPHLASFQNAYNQWTWMRDNKLTEATFEDYLRTWGIKAEGAASEQLNRPELIRYVRDWAYPANTIVPETGVASSAVSWAVAERADKARFFAEPGFLFGVCVTRPKVYFRGQLGHVAATWDTALEWLPPTAQSEMPYTSVVESPRTAGPIANVPNAADTAYWWDQRDLLLYGDQFMNYTMPGTQQPSDANSVALPRSDGAGSLVREYVALSDINTLFNDPAAGTNGTNKIRSDGVVSLSILGHQMDQT